MALKTAPNWPAVSLQLEYQSTWIRSASWSIGIPTGPMPPLSPRSPGQQAMPSMSERFSPASSIACIAASSVRVRADLVCGPRLTLDWPIPVIATVFSA